MPSPKRRRRRIFPTFAVVLIAIGIVWLLNSLNLVSIDLPWLPIIIIIIGVGIFVNNYWEQE